MSLDKVRKLLKSAYHFQKRGEHFAWGGLTHISKDAGIPRPTTYRYLEKLVKLGMMYKEQYSYHGEKSYRYRLTNEGVDYLAGWRELPTLEIE